MHISNMYKIFTICIILTVSGFAFGQQFADERPQTEIDGSIDLTDLGEELDFFAVCRNVISSRMGGLEYIYRKHKKDNNKFSGQIMVKIVVNREGEVTECKITRSQLNSIAFQNEIRQKIMTWRFGRVKNDKQEVFIPFYFK